MFDFLGDISTADGLIAAAITGLLAVATFLNFGAKIVKYVKALKESVDVVLAALIALSDGKVTADEVKKIKDEFEEATAAWKNPS